MFNGTLKIVLLCIIAMAGIVITDCDNNSTSPTGNETINLKGKYLMDSYCIANVSTLSVNPVSIDSLLSVADCAIGTIIGCDEVKKDSTKCCLSMSTIIITDDSLVRFGFHCPGDNSGSTRSAYGYVYNDGKLTGDLLSGDVKTAEGESSWKTFLKKNSDESIVITQLQSLTIYENDSTYYLLYKSTYKKSDNTCYNYNDLPTCSENYEPRFPIPVW
jgi:hypothetical protein